MDFARRGTFRSPSLDELPVFREFDDPVVAGFAMAVRHKDGAIRRDGDIRREIESVGTIAGDPGFPERHQNFTLRTELENLLALSVPALRVRHPEISLRVHASSVREYEHSHAEALQKFARLVISQNRRFRAAGAGVRKTAFNYIDAAVGTRLHSGYRGPFHASRQFSPIAYGAIRSGQIVHWRIRITHGSDFWLRQGASGRKYQRGNYRP